MTNALPSLPPVLHDRRRTPWPKPSRRPTAFSPSTEHTERHEMKIVVIGGTGLIGSKLVEQIAEGRSRAARGVA